MDCSTHSPNEYRSYFTLRHRAISLGGTLFPDGGGDFNVYGEGSYTRSRVGQPHNRAEDVLVDSGSVVLSWHGLHPTGNLSAMACFRHPWVERLRANEAATAQSHPRRRISTLRSCSECGGVEDGCRSERPTPRDRQVLLAMVDLGQAHEAVERTQTSLP